MSEVYRSPEFTKAMNEYFDVQDSKTRKILLAVNEADQNKILTSLTSKLYDNIIDKVDEIDFGDIPSTKGDITKLPNYNKIIESANLIRDILTHYNEKTDPADTLLEAISNIESRKSLFTRAYQLNVEMPIIFYNTMTLAVINGLSYLIAAVIDYIKVPNEDGFKISLNKVAVSKVQQGILFENLEKFNSSCKKGEFDKAMNHIISQNVKNFTGMEIGVVAGIALALGLILNIIPIIRELIFFFYYSRTTTAQYFETQSKLLEMNAYSLELHSTMDKEKRERVIKKQLKVAETFRKISNFFMVDAKTAEKQATKDIISTNKKMKADDVLDSVPDSATDTLF